MSDQQSTFQTKTQQQPILDDLVTETPISSGSDMQIRDRVHVLNEFDSETIETEIVMEAGDERGNVFYLYEYHPYVKYEVYALQAEEICVEIGRTAFGVGVFAVSDITPQSLILVYSGELISHTEADEREAYRDLHSSELDYMLDIADHVIDATNVGNFAQYRNHSCNPNSTFKFRTLSNGEVVPVVQATELIHSGTEVTLDYGMVIE